MSDHIERLERIVRERNLAGERGQIGLSQHSGASKSVVNQWLDNKIKSIHPRYAQRMEHDLGYRSDWITTGHGPVYVDGSDAGRVPVILQTTLLANQMTELMSLFIEADDLGRTTILSAARNAKKRD